MQTQDDYVIVIEGLHYRRGGKIIFDGVDLYFKRGHVTAIMGPSGVGKTTLLRLITGQLAPDAGTVWVDGQDVAKLTRKQLYVMRKRMGMLFQNGALLTDFDVYENVAFPLREHTQLPETLIHPLILTKLQAVGLRGAAGLMPAQLSGGMARRVALARAIVMDPEMIFYDEPFTGLDPIASGVVVRLIRRLNQTLGLTSVIVSHDVEELSAVSDWAYLLANGQVFGEGSPQELQASSSALVQQFMQGLADGPVGFHYPGSDYQTELFGEVEG